LLASGDIDNIFEVWRDISTIKNLREHCQFCDSLREICGLFPYIFHG